MSKAGVKELSAHMKTVEAAPAFKADINSPRWLCKKCEKFLCIVDADSSADASIRPPFHGVLSERMDHSFVLLQEHRGQNRHSVQNQSGIATSNSPSPSFPLPRPRPPSTAAYPGMPSQGLHHHQIPTSESGERHVARALNESFIVLPSAAASLYRRESTAESTGSHRASATFNARIHVLTRVFDIASSRTLVEYPLCQNCILSLCDELDKEREEIERDIKVYEACISMLEKEQNSSLREEEFLKEKQKVEEEERRIEAALKLVERQNEDVVAQLQELDLKSKQFRELEESYWHQFNDFKLQLTTHQEEKDALLVKIEISEAQLDMLKHTNVLNDAFHIDHDGEFGTINNFRLGRLPSIRVEWEEINAAWGQACLLLFTMAQYSHHNLTYRIVPMGSYSCIADSKKIYKLHGPVNVFWSNDYNEAMIMFLACIKEFADFANNKDREANIPLDKCFRLPYKIENDKVEGLEIKQNFYQPKDLTKALKYMLCDLKWALYWLIGNSTFQPSPSVSLPHGKSISVDTKNPSRMQRSSK